MRFLARLRAGQCLEHEVDRDPAMRRRQVERVLSVPALEAIRFAVGRDRDDVVAGTTRARCPTRPVRQRVGVLATVQNVVAGTAHQGVSPGSSEQPVAPGAAGQRVGAPSRRRRLDGRPPRRVRSRPRRTSLPRGRRRRRCRGGEVERVLSVPALEAIRFAVGRDRDDVVAGTTRNDVRARPRRQRVGVLATVQTSSPATARQGVSPGSSKQPVAPGAAGQRVGARAADRRPRSTPPRRVRSRA